MNDERLDFRKTGEMLRAIVHCPVCVVTWDMDAEPDPGCPHESPDPAGFVFPGDDLYDNYWTVKEHSQQRAPGKQRIDLSELPQEKG